MKVQRWAWCCCSASLACSASPSLRPLALHQGGEIEQRLLLQPVVDHAADLEIAVDGAHDLGFRHALGELAPPSACRAWRAAPPPSSDAAACSRTAGRGPGRRWMHSMKWRCVIHSRCRISSATDSGLCFSTASAITSGGPITSHSVLKPFWNSARKRLKRSMCLASSPANCRKARAARVVAGKPRAHVVEQEGQDELLDQAEHGRDSRGRGSGSAAASRRADRLSSGAMRASASGMNGLPKSSRFSPPIMSSTRQLMRCEAARADA